MRTIYLALARVCTGGIMSDGFSLSDLLNPDVLVEALNRYQGQTQQIANDVMPDIDVPIREIPPPVEIYGTLNLRATFQFDQIQGKNYNQIVQMVMDVLMNPQGNNPWLPEVSIGNLVLERRRVGRTETTQPRAIPEIGHASYRADDGYPDTGVTDTSTEPG
jgi:hypothetical protein